MEPSYPLKNGANPLNPGPSPPSPVTPSTVCALSTIAAPRALLAAAFISMATYTLAGDVVLTSRYLLVMTIHSCPHDYPVCDVNGGTCLISKNNPLKVKALKRSPARVNWWPRSGLVRVGLPISLRLGSSEEIWPGVMDSGSADVSNSRPVTTSNVARSTAVESAPVQSTEEVPSKLSTSGISSWAKNLKIPQPFTGSQDEQSPGNASKSTFARFTGGLGMRLSPKSPTDEHHDGTSTSPTSFIGTFTKGLVDSSKNAVKAVQVKARHVVSQNKRRYQEGGFDLDLTYITENIIAMGFPAGDMSSGLFGYVEGFYRNHMEEVIKFFETHHKDKYKVYNLCSERLYDASLFEGKVACFPFDDHNCPPIQLIISFCHSAYSWLKEDIENVVVVHCKAGMARTGLMISSLLLYLKFFPTAEESMDYYNQKRCVDGKGLVLPSQIRYVKYFERVLTYFNGENQPGRRCMLRGFRLHRCPYWIRPSITVSDHNGVLFSAKKHPRTKDLSVGLINVSCH
ncbi:Phosphatidylinositol 3,4,5-trisphosphate 3-phosphatase and protein-tyrosine-phosphatase pten2a, partial [Datura stramonium]|nr:Phosphatidylinositol 3,4,5-trisphosphate 3-phosphatase and protein-tyrosine-phosphatase pten2a [Datura stramonium]